MIFKKIDPPRVFKVGKKKNNISIKDTLHIKKVKKKDIISFETNKTKINYSFLEWGFLIDNNLKTKNKDYYFTFFGNNYEKIHLGLLEKKKMNLY